MKNKISNLKNRKKTPIIVQKYGGATLETPEKILQVAKRIAHLSRSKVNVVVAVSAMGKTTNQLISLSQSISKTPNRRELDMLLTTGERISMALISMALNDLDCPAISFTGSQAGILTDDSHVNASIVDVQAHRVVSALKKGKVVVLAGFQGVSPTSKEITTLGRGGTDTTAVAMAAFLKAVRCEILKDVPGVFTADPKIILNAKPINKISYEQMLEMTFWGAKVLHYRSVELAKQKSVDIYIGPASKNLKLGTVISHGDSSMKKYETSKVLALNSHHRVLHLICKNKKQNNYIELLAKDFQKNEIAFPQILFTQLNKQGIDLFITGADEILEMINNCYKKSSLLKINPQELCSVSVTCTGATNPEIFSKTISKLKKAHIHPKMFFLSAMSLNFFIEKSAHKKALQQLHKLI